MSFQCNFQFPLSPAIRVCLKLFRDVAFDESGVKLNTKSKNS